MFTHCPNTECGSVYRITAETLSAAMGMIRCVKCRTVFNALGGLVEKRPDRPVIPISNQLPFQQFGDRTVMDSAVVQNLPWFKSLKSDEADDPNLFTRTGSFVGISSDDDNYATERATRLKAAEAELGDVAVTKYAADTPPSLAQYSQIAAIRWREFLPSLSDLYHTLRNLTRHRRRSAMGLLAISFGVIAMLLSGGFIEWSGWFLRETTIHAHLGHIQLVKKDYFKRGEADPFAYLMHDDPATLKKIEALREVEMVTPRLSFSGLISFGDASISFLGEGVDPEREARVSKRLTIVSGQGLSSASPKGIIVGKGLAENLKIKAGDTVVLLASPENGGLGAVEARILGTFQTSSKAYDDASIRVPIAMARETLKVNGSHRWIILLRDTNLTAVALQKLRSTFGNRTDLEFVPWFDLADFYNKTAKLFDAQLNVIWIVIALIIVVSISNTLIMNVVERTGEIGTLMALGLKRRKILALFITEGLMLGTVGGLVGAALGCALGALISHVGIPMPPAPGMDFPVKGQIMITASTALGGALLGVAATIAASIYPARKASRLEIVDALRHAR